MNLPNPTVQILEGDCRAVLATLPEKSVHCIVTSPPYWGLRDYGTAPLVWGSDSAHDHEWGDPTVRDNRAGAHLNQGLRDDPARSPRGGRQPANQQPAVVDQGAFCSCGAWRGSLGLEPTPELYVEHLVEIFRAAWRVLRDDGILWLNLGDSYNAGREGGHAGGKCGLSRPEIAPNRSGVKAPDLKPKDLVGIPWRAAFALQADGWYLRRDIIWAKPNPMPESCTDRCTSSHEYLFHLTKSPTYFYDSDAIHEPLQASSSQQSANRDPESLARILQQGRNKRSVWTIPTKPYKEAHFAVFPPDLVKPCILAGTSAKGCCVTCGAPWERMIVREKHPIRDMEAQRRRAAETTGRIDGKVPGPGGMMDYVRSVGWRPTCVCGTDETRPCVVLDLFGGSGTVGAVAKSLNRNSILIDLNAKYLRLAMKRAKASSAGFGLE